MMSWKKCVCFLVIPLLLYNLAEYACLGFLANKLRKITVSSSRRHLCLGIHALGIPLHDLDPLGGKMDLFLIFCTMIQLVIKLTDGSCVICMMMHGLLIASIFSWVGHACTLLYRSCTTSHGSRLGSIDDLQSRQIEHDLSTVGVHLFVCLSRLVVGNNRSNRRQTRACIARQNLRQISRKKTVFGVS